MQIDRDVFLASLRAERPSLACFSIYATDALSHRFWRFHEPERFTDVTDAEVARYGEVVRDAYRQADTILGELVQMLPEQADIIVVSDHGFQALDGDGGRVVPRTEPLESWLRSRGINATVLRQGAKLRVHSTSDELDRVLGEFVQAHQLETEAPIFRIESIPHAPSARGLAVIDHQEGVSLDATFRDGRGLDTVLRSAHGMSGDHHRDGIFFGDRTRTKTRARCGY